MSMCDQLCSMMLKLGPNMTQIFSSCNAMVGQCYIRSVVSKPGDCISLKDLLDKFFLFGATVELHTCRLGLFEHAKRSDNMPSVMIMALPGKRGRPNLFFLFVWQSKDNYQIVSASYSTYKGLCL